jgi:O-antigen/teichoic acid export membrane protein
VRDIWSRVAAAGTARVIGLAATTLGLFLSARWLGPEARGIVAATLTWVIVVGTVAHLSLGQVALARRSSDPNESFGALVGTLMATAGALTVAGWTFALVASLFPGGAFRGIPALPLVIGFAALPFVIWEQYGSYLLMSIDRLPVYNKAQVAGRSLELLLVCVLVGVLGAGVNGALSASFVGQATVSLLGLRVLLRAGAEAGGVRAELPMFRRLLAGGLRLHLGAVGALLVSYVDVLVVQHALGAHETGLYQLAVQVCAVLLVVPQAAAQVMYSRVAVEGADRAWTHHRKILIGIPLLVAVAGGLAALLAPWVVPLTVGEKFIDVVPVFRVLVLSVVGRAIGFVMGPQWIARGLFWQASAITLALGASDVLLAMILAPRAGIVGVAWASVGVYTVGAIINLVFALRISRGLARAPHLLDPATPSDVPLTDTVGQGTFPG